MRKIHCVGGSNGYANWCQATEMVDNVKDADLVVFTGGCDVNPARYNRGRHPTTYFNEERDKEEIREFNYAQSLGKPILGICRGAQLSCVMAGGILIQDQEDPKHYHDVTTSDGQTIAMTSIHHQAMYPWYLKQFDFKVLGWTKGISKHHHGQVKGVDILGFRPPEDGRELEICYFPWVRALGIQGHPEMMYSKMNLNKEVAKSIVYCRGLLDKLMDGQL